MKLFRLRDGAGEEGSLQVALLSSGDIEAERIARIRTALEQKAPKLEAARPPCGRTLLVLESQDLFLSNDVVIDRAIYIACKDFSPLPDHIVCVDSSIGNEAWRSRAVKSGPKWSAAACNV